MLRLVCLPLLLLLVSVLAAQETKVKVIESRKHLPVQKTITVQNDGKVEVRTITEYVPVVVQQEINPSKSAIIICDMWDNHWCPSAAKRCDVLAKKVAPIIDSARKSGMTVIHCPSDTMKFYADHAARQRAKSVKTVKPPEEKKLPDPALPIDDKDGGCDDVPSPKTFRAWTRQHEAIKIDADKDYITDVGTEVYSILQDRKIDHIFVMGVHTNMCVLHRSFAIKQLRRWDLNCFLVRDITDTMYNPKSAPYVSHDEGTDLVVKYIEKHWCPSVLSSVLAK